MRITSYGTRGSTPISSPEQVVYGGNTTCVRVESECLGEGKWLFVDAGTGIVPAGRDFCRQGGKVAVILHTHVHHDHTQGFPLSCFPYMKKVPVFIFGPYEHGIGPRETYEAILKKPFFPVNLAKIAAHIRFKNIEEPDSAILVFHPLGGTRKLTVEEFENIANDGQQVPFPGESRFSIEDCMVVRMMKSNHPENTIVYRFEENPTGQVFVFLTDHENQDGIPRDTIDHIKGADLLIQDCQYTRERYDSMTAGFGHATPDYVARLAKVTGVKAVGLTHHDPSATDVDIDKIVATAKELILESGMNIPVFGCHDYDVFDIGKLDENQK